MKALKIILIIVVVLAAIYFIGGLLLPKTYSVSRSVAINAPDSVVYKNVADFNNFLKWNPWSKMEPEAKEVISGPVSQPGHMYTWDGEKTGQGQMTIERTEPYKLIDFELKFIKPFESLADTKFSFEPAANQTTVSWTMQGNNNTTMEKWMSLMMDGMLGKDFESGLKSLKEISEKE
ncbi:SRPBCC family protein [Paradesertivirga mongoliensis]|uniref:SRPBCC family protein n=1 Tax=Paradesertivirga mongoliensis TaxID=2100740 RepID=A0ABW4ZJF8_9SPHI|nr:SRPBCC family protein [Pedobacter mongoliensis]